MPEYKHILFVTNEYDLTKKIATDLWYKNKSWCVASTDNIYDYSIKKILTDENYKMIIITSPEKIVKRNVNEFIKFCKKLQILPIFVTKTESYDTDIVHTMYTNVEDVLEGSFEYIHNDSDEVCYNYMTNIMTEYLW